MLQQYLPFTVLKLKASGRTAWVGCCTLQQYLPFTVLKLVSIRYLFKIHSEVATVLTVYGIETEENREDIKIIARFVATVLTVYGIETSSTRRIYELLLDVKLQQYLPFTVLKLTPTQCIG